MARKIRKSKTIGRDNCRLSSVSVYATAGMRIAEQDNPERAIRLWNKLKEKLKEKTEPGTVIQTKTLTGFEEGLFAWMTLNNENNNDQNFGIVEMGGASAQIAFPCQDCEGVKPVVINGSPTNMFSYSFLGLGSNEAGKTIGQAPKLGNLPTYCGTVNPKALRYEYKEKCEDSLKLTTSSGSIIDPYNYASNNTKGTDKALPSFPPNVTQWFGTGAFSHHSNSDEQNYCIEGKKSKFEPKTACFRAVYFQKFLETVGVKQYEKADSSWTKGAAICDKDNCLENAKLECNWLKNQECLKI